MNHTPSPHEDTRLADFKLLLPLGPDARVLVVDCSDPLWLPHLCGEVGTLDWVTCENATSPPTGWTATMEESVRHLSAPSGEYDIILSDSAAPACHLRAGGVLCRFNTRPGLTPSTIPSVTAHEERVDLKHLGRWWALPQWPGFRALVPDDPNYIEAAASELHLLSRDRGLIRRLMQAVSPHPTLSGRVCIDLFYRADAKHPQCIIDRIEQALHTSKVYAEAPSKPWLLVSGRLGPGNPIVVFQAGKDQHLDRLIKIARYPGTRHLIEEAEKIDEIRAVLGETLAAPLIVPTAIGTHEGRAAIAYEFVPTLPFFGLRWRLKTRDGYCRAMTDWLAAVAQRTICKSAPNTVDMRHIRPLADLCARGVLPAPMQQVAEQALQQLHQSDTLPECLEHGDLGIYNTRLCTPNGKHFRVIDWASSTPRGIALGDLGYLLASAHAPQALSKNCLARYLDALSLPHALAPALWFSYLARRWAELDTVRPPVANDPTSGGGILIEIHNRIALSIEALAS